MKLFHLSLLAGWLLFLLSCQEKDTPVPHVDYPVKDAEKGKWRQVLDTNDINISSQVFFSIGPYGYSINQRTNEVYRYDATTLTIKKMNNFPGLRRQSNATAFAIRGKGYYGLGRSITRENKSDFWEYDPAADKWTQKMALPLIPNQFGSLSSQYAVIGIGIGDTGYVFSGRRNDNNSITNRWFAFDPRKGDWLPKNTDPLSYPPQHALITMAFTIGDKGYIGDSTRLWVFNPKGGQRLWEMVKPNPDLPIPYKQPFISLGPPSTSSVKKGYVYGSIKTTNSLNPELLNGFWEFDPAGPSWVPLAPFEGEARGECLGFFLNDKVYIGFGSTLKASVLKDVWEYTP